MSSLLRKQLQPVLRPVLNSRSRLGPWATPSECYPSFSTANWFVEPASMTSSLMKLSLSGCHVPWCANRGVLTFWSAVKAIRVLVWSRRSFVVSQQCSRYGCASTSRKPIAVSFSIMKVVVNFRLYHPQRGRYTKMASVRQLCVTKRHVPSVNCAQIRDVWWVRIIVIGGRNMQNYRSWPGEFKMIFHCTMKSLELKIYNLTST